MDSSEDAGNWGKGMILRIQEAGKRDDDSEVMGNMKKDYPEDTGYM